MKKMIILLLFSANFAISLSLYGSGEGLMKKLKYTRDIKGIEAKSGGELLTFPIDKPVYEHSEGVTGNFRDMRLINLSGNREVPFRIRKIFTTLNRKYRVICDSQVISMKKLSENRIEVVIRNLDKEKFARFIIIRSSDENYDKQVTVAVSADGKNWIPFAKSQAIFDYSAIIDLSNDVIQLPEKIAKQGRYYKLTIGNFSEKSLSGRMEIIKEQRAGKEFSEIKKMIQKNSTFRIDQIVLKAEVEKKVDKSPLLVPVTAGDVSVKNKSDYTVITSDLFKQPVMRIEFNADSLNFSRKVDLYSSDDMKKWRAYSNGYISSVAIGDFHRTNLAVNTPEIRARYIRIVIHNGDAPALDNLSVQYSASLYNADFILPDKNSTLKLLYGGEVLSPEYDIDEILAKIADPEYMEVKLGKEELNPLYSPEKSGESFLNSRAFLYAAIALMVIVLGIALLKSMKKIENV